MNGTKISLSLPDITSVEEEAVLAAVRSGWVAPLGPDVDAFEAEMCERIGVKYAVALSSGTAALHLGLLGLGVDRGDVVITSTLTFAATANAVVYTGAQPYFIDCDSVTGNMDTTLLAEAVDALTKRGEKVAAILPVDLFGKAANYTEIESVAAEFEIPVLADAAESLGATHAAKQVGSHGRAAVFSFNGNKIMTTSGGGMLMTDDPNLAERARYLATQARQPVDHYEHHDIGFNYRMSNILAALGRAQLSRLDSMIEKRREVRHFYRNVFADVSGVSIFADDLDGNDNCWLTSILIDPDEVDWNVTDLRLHLKRQNIETRPIWKPMHQQPVFQQNLRAHLDGNADAIFKHGLVLPSGSILSTAELERIASSIRQFLSMHAA